MARETLRLYDIEFDGMSRAISVARSFSDNYPDRRGARDGAVYSNPTEGAVYAYRTQAGVIVVRGIA